MKTDVLGYGIDFGSTNSLISIAYLDRVEVLSINQYGDFGLNKCMPTFVYFDRNADYRTGDDAIDEYVITAQALTYCSDCRLDCHNYMKDDHACLNARLAHGIKMALADTQYYGTYSWGHKFQLEDMVAWILMALRKLAADTLYDVTLPVVVGVPVEYDGEKEGSREVAIERMRRGASVAGFQNIEFLEEPIAALIDQAAAKAQSHIDGVCVAVDFGGGTCDVAVSSSGSSPWAPESTQGVAIGGELFNSLLFTEIIAPRLGLENVVNRHKWLSNRSSMVMAVGQAGFRNKLSKASDGESQLLIKIINRGQVNNFWHAIKETKIDLSSKENSSVEFHKQDIHISEPVSRADFERVIARSHDAVAETIKAALSAAQISHEDVKHVIKTGGSSALPIFNRMLDEMFPNAVMEARPALTTIASGLGEYIRIKDELNKPVFESNDEVDALPGHVKDLASAERQLEKSSQNSWDDLATRIKRFFGRS